jgi:Lrp/AsnC family transcriptional regulator for asnA, asnC and gidA
MDLLDTQIIELLIRDANVSSTSLAKQLNVSSSTVRRRMKDLLEKEIIRIKASPNLEKFGLPVVAFISLEVSHEKLKTVLRKLSDFPHAAWVGATSGLFNVRTVWWVSSTEELYNLLESEIGKIDGINRIETSICLQIEKRESSSTIQMLTKISNSVQ